jgi:hypothetical protein
MYPRVSSLAGKKTGRAALNLPLYAQLLNNVPKRISVGPLEGANDNIETMLSQTTDPRYLVFSILHNYALDTSRYELVR